MRPKYPHRKQIKTYYETQLSTDPILNDKIERKNSIRKNKKITRVNSG
jgi:hypothetical protein